MNETVKSDTNKAAFYRSTALLSFDIFNSTDIRNIARNSSREKKICSTAHIEQIGQKPWDSCAIDRLDGG